MSHEEKNGDTGKADSKKLNKTERMMLDILSDGKRHPRKELHACCGPSRFTIVSVHICNLRKKLPRGQDILCVARDNSHFYQLVRLIASANDGRK